MKTLLIAIVAISLFTTGCNGKHSHGDHEGSNRLVNMKTMVLDYLGPESEVGKPALLDGDFELIDFSHEEGDNAHAQTDFDSGAVTFRWLGEITDNPESEDPFVHHGILDMNVTYLGFDTESNEYVNKHISLNDMKMNATFHDYIDINGIWSSADKQYGRFVFYDNDTIEYQISHNWFTAYDVEVNDGRKFLTRMLFRRKAVPVEPGAIAAPINNG